MTIKARNRWIHSSIFSVLAAFSFHAMADTSGAISTAGITGSYDQYKLKSNLGSQNGHLPKAGVFYNYGNKMTGGEGLIYQAGVEATFGEKHSNRLKEGRGQADLGWRMAIDNQNYVDALVGAGYDWSRYEPDTSGNDLRLTAKGPFAKAALGYNHAFDNTTTLRLEGSVRRQLNERARLHVQHEGSESVDIHDRTNPYAEMDMLFNQNGKGLPITAGLYYEHHEDKLKDRLALADNVKLKHDEYGAKVGVAF